MKSPRLAPSSPGTGPALRRRKPSGRLVNLEQIPVWAGFGSPIRNENQNPGLEALLEGLNPEQRRAVTHGTGPLLVVAGAGTGKTEVITRRIAWLVATRRARPSQILGLTFTDKAAAEMQLRVDQLVPYGFADTAISTFHAFGDRLIREFAFELGISPDARVLSRAEVVVLLREHLFELGLDTYLPLGDPTRFLGALATLFGRCRDEDVTPDRYRTHADELAAAASRAGSALVTGPEPFPVDRAAADALVELADRQIELATAYSRYTELLAASGAIDFGDQVALALRLMRSSPASLATIRNRFRYILVDEFQDTNPVQAALVGLLAEEHRNLTVVGDDDQSIYRFRGAAISNILEFRDHYPAARTVVLRRNYRSLAPILDASHRLIKFNDPDRLESRVGISKKLLPQRSQRSAPPVRVHGFDTAAAEADWIAAEVRRRMDAGVRPRDFAVLVRANAGADAVLRSFNIAGVPWRFAGTSGLYGRPEIRLLLSVLRAVTDPESSTDVYGLAASDIYRVPSEDLSAIMGAARRGHDSAWGLLEQADAGTGGVRVTAPGRAAIARLVGDLRRLRDLAHARPAGEVLYAFLQNSGWLAEMAAGGTARSEEMLANVARFFDIVRSRSALLVDDRAVFLIRHLATLIDAGDDPGVADTDPDVDAVSVLTVHKAKGLEFPVVVIPGLVAGRFPSSARREPLEIPDALVAAAPATADPHLPEERRLF
ncbi:MAG: ATP-dependent helicase, partial [Chloroflexi bacterium]|nr:ATP-dependent helicase [Chloroflexota bacterium]